MVYIGSKIKYRNWSSNSTVIESAPSPDGTDALFFQSSWDWEITSNDPVASIHNAFQIPEIIKEVKVNILKKLKEKGTRSRASKSGIRPTTSNTPNIEDTRAHASQSVAHPTTKSTPDVDDTTSPTQSQTWEGIRSPLVGMLERGLLIQHVG
uniref:Uncharacterized protein n=1 Tax=Nelumbo nucifera TaxID=4432 RepID=A0A822YX61_NELNU|nr:TPA_asm: hypothetical protein HUJ06_007741 [Nelumbo nucifera]